MVRLRPGVEWQRVDDEIVVLDLNASSYLAINDSGAVLWPLVASGATTPELVDELKARYNIDAAQAEADVSAFIERLRSYTLVDVEER